MEQIPTPILVEPGVVEKPRIVTFKIHPKDLELVDLAAMHMGVSRSELIREALSYYLREVLGLTKD